MRALPKNLEETYQRLLSQSDTPVDLKTFLQWVALAVRPITLQELAETTAVNFGSPLAGRPFYDPKLRYLDSRDVLTVCSGFLTVFEG